MRTGGAYAALSWLFLLPGPARAASVDAPAACQASVTPESLLRHPTDPELYDYAACSELISGRTDLCDAFPGGPASGEAADLRHEVVRSDGKVHLDSLYGVCYSRAAAYRLLSLLVKGGASDDALRAQMKLLLHDEDLPVDEILRTYVQVFKTGSLAGVTRPDLARIGFFNHLVGRAACAEVSLDGLRRECVRKAAALEALRAKDASKCLAGDFLCEALLSGKEVCRKMGRRIVRRVCNPPASKPKDRPSS